jgi:flagellar protein FlgJ
MATLPSISGSAATDSTVLSAPAYTNIKGLGDLKAHGQDPASLKLAAQQFEALFLEMMLKSMRSASLGEGIMDSDEGKLYQDMFDKQVSVSMSQKSSLGIAEMMLRQLSPPSASPAGLGPQGGPLRLTDRIASTLQQLPATADRPSITPLLAAMAKFQPEQVLQSLPETAPTVDIASAQTAKASSPSEFVAAILPLARRAAEALGVNPLGIVAQAALETGWGQRLAKLADGTPGFNLFGIKAGDNWQGKKLGADTLEFTDGVAQQRRETFRAYDSVAESVADYVRLVKGSPRYQQALAAGQNAHAYAQGLASGGYATDPDYAKKISDILNSSTLRQALEALKK